MSTTVPALSYLSTYKALEDVTETSTVCLPSSLVTSSETVPELSNLCPRRGSNIFYNLNNPAQFSLGGCDAYKCIFCGPKKVSKFVEAIAWTAAQSPRSRFVTLTQAPEEWQARRKKMRVLASKIRSQGLNTEWAWTTEVGKKNGMIHVHAVQTGDFIPQKMLSEMWGRRVDIRAIKKDEKAVSRYIAKSNQAVTKYMAKGKNEEYEAWLGLNGERPFHTSRAFFMGLGVRGAYKASQAERNGAEAPVWAMAEGALARAYYDLRIANTKEEQEKCLTRVIALAT